MLYDLLLKEAEKKNVKVEERDLPETIKGLQGNNHIWINNKLSSRAKAGILAEELGHYETTYGNIIDQHDQLNRKQELQARTWGYKKALPLSQLIEAHECGVEDLYELAEFLDLDEQFIIEAIERFKAVYGHKVDYEKYTINFDPLKVIKEDY